MIWEWRATAHNYVIVCVLRLNNLGSVGLQGYPSIPMHVPFLPINVYFVYCEVWV